MYCVFLVGRSSNGSEAFKIQMQQVCTVLCKPSVFSPTWPHNFSLTSKDRGKWPIVIEKLNWPASMVGGLRFFVDEDSAIFGKLHFLLSFLGPCEINDSFLPQIASHSYCIMVGGTYENDEFRLLVTIVDQPKGANNLKNISRNTGVMTYILNGLVKLSTSTLQPYSTLRLLLGICIYLAITFVRIFLFMINLLLVSFGLSNMKPLLKWPSFGIDLRSDTGLSLVHLQFTSDEKVRMSLPCIIFDSSIWAVIFDISIGISIVLKSDILQVSASKMKISVTAESAIPTLNQMVEEFAALRGLNGRQGAHEKKLKLSERRQLIIPQSYCCTVSGDMLGITLNESMLRASIYLKGKYFAEKYFDNKHYENNLILRGAKLFSVKFSRFQLHGISDGPRCVAMDMSLIITNSLSSNTPHKNENSDGLDYCSRVEHSCKQLQIRSNAHIEHQILLDDINASYNHCYGDYTNNRSIVCPKEICNVHIQCKKIEINTVDGNSYGIIEKNCKSAVKFLTLLSTTLFGVCHDKCSCSFLIDEFCLIILYWTSLPCTSVIKCHSTATQAITDGKKSHKDVTLSEKNGLRKRVRKNGNSGGVHNMAVTADKIFNSSSNNNNNISNNKNKNNNNDNNRNNNNNNSNNKNNNNNDNDNNDNNSYDNDNDINYIKSPKPFTDAKRYTSTFFLSNISGSISESSKVVNGCNVAQYFAEEGSSGMFENVFS